MKVLSLIIKQEFFDQILSGEKKQEFREIRPNTEKKYCEIDEDGFAKEIDGVLIPRKYDAIQFYVGYNKDRDNALVEIKYANIELFVDDKGNFIEYEYQGDICTAAQIVYDLGDVLNKNV